MTVPRRVTPSRRARAGARYRSSTSGVREAARSRSRLARFSAIRFISWNSASARSPRRCSSDVTMADWEEPVLVLARILAERGWAAARIGLEMDSNYLTVSRWQAMARALPGASLVDFGGVLRELRLLKSPAEIGYLREAAGIADRAMRAAIAAVAEGRSERQAAVAASRTFVELGADHGRAGVITSGPRAGSLHGTLGHRELRAGDLRHLELVPQVHGYSARLMREALADGGDTEVVLSHFVADMDGAESEALRSVVRRLRDPA